MPQPKNILLISTDQQRFDTINALGNPHIHTPHLNWLVDEGIAFSRCYADSPVCVPSRATIMSGRHGYRSGLTGNNERGFSDAMSGGPTMPELLTANGYQTRAQGKMHFHPVRCNYGFEHMELPLDFYRDQLSNRSRGLSKQHGIGENEVSPVISTVPETESLTYWTVQRSIDFLETRDETRPFFLWTSFAKPHPPFDPCVNYWELYRDRPVPDPVAGDWSTNYDDIPNPLRGPSHFLAKTHRLSPEQIADMRRAYYACITQIDYQLGLLFASLQSQGLLESTWIIFTSDHGDLLGDHHLGAKSQFLEGAAHVPMIIRPPFGWEGTRGQRCDQLVTLADVYPTVAALAGIDTPTHVDGESLLDRLGATTDRTFYGRCDDRAFCVLDGDWKYLWFPEGGHELLFDLGTDPYERRSLQPTDHSERYSHLRSLLVAHLEESGTKFLQDGELVTLPDRKLPMTSWPGFIALGSEYDTLH